MKYDPSLIKTEVVEIGGKKVTVERIPTGMHGPNGGLAFEFEDTFSEEDYEEFTSDDPSVYKEFLEYTEEGVEPDSDEVRAYKNDLELEEVKSMKLLDSVELEEEYDEFSVPTEEEEEQ